VLAHDQVLKMKDSRLIQLLEPELKLKHPILIEQENARRAYYDAASKDDYEAMKKISDPHADPNYINSNEPDTPIGLAINHRNLDMVKLLIERKADPNALDFMKKHPISSTPLMCAVSCIDIQITMYLLKHGADILQRDGEGDDVTAYLKSKIVSQRIMKDLITKRYLAALDLR
jgi:ankyrin repeat protein